VISSVSPAGFAFATVLPPEATAVSSIVAPPLGASIFVQSNSPPSASAGDFAGSYAPEIYGVYLNGLLASVPAPPAVLETNLYTVSDAQPPIGATPEPPLPGAPPIQPSPQVDGVQQVVAAIAQLAGRGHLAGATSGTVPTVTGGTDARQTAASSHSPSPATTR